MSLVQTLPTGCRVGRYYGAKKEGNNLSRVIQRGDEKGSSQIGKNWMDYRRFISEHLLVDSGTALRVIFREIVERRPSKHMMGTGPFVSTIESSNSLLPARQSGQGILRLIFSKIRENWARIRRFSAEPDCGESCRERLCHN